MTYNTLLTKSEYQTLEEIRNAQSSSEQTVAQFYHDNSSTLSSPNQMDRTFLGKTDSDNPMDMAIDMFISSIDISFFALPMVIQAEGLVLSAGFFAYLIVCALMASQCYIELKRLSTARRVGLRSSRQKYVGLMDLIDECCE